LKKRWINYRQADNGRRKACVNKEIHFINCSTKLTVLFVYQGEDLSEIEAMGTVCCYCLATRRICVKKIKI
jgi:hypothetical protein